jgi:hypothetical protein
MENNMFFGIMDQYFKKDKSDKEKEKSDKCLDKEKSDKCLDKEKDIKSNVVTAKNEKIGLYFSALPLVQ